MSTQIVENGENNSYDPVICSGLTKDDLTTQVVDPVSLNTIVSVLLTLPVVQGVILVFHILITSWRSGLNAPTTTGILHPHANLISPSPRDSLQ